MGVPALTAPKIAIVGFTESRNDAPWSDPTWEKWPVNNLWKFLTEEQLAGASRWFDLHDHVTVVNDVEHVEWIKAGTKPVFVLPDVARREPEWPVHAFPQLEILEWAEQHDLAGRRYFTNSISWLIAHAIALLDGVPGGEIALYGVDMAQGTEYSSQRPSCEYWLGIAEGRGIRVSVAERADLLRTAFIYGVDRADDFTTKMRARTEELQTRLAEANVKAEELAAAAQQNDNYRHQLTGALESQQYIEGVWLQPGNIRKGGDDPYADTGVSTSGQ